jgi:DNA-binding NarL/FixJ family response regulator
MVHKRTGARRDLKGARIVVADDDPLILDQIATYLETCFDVVARVGNGLELVEAVNRFKPAVVIADIAMPEMNGIEATRKIRKAHRDVKVVMLSGYNDDVLVDAAFEAGASGYVVKLSAFTDLIPAIQNVLGGQVHKPDRAS